MGQIVVTATLHTVLREEYVCIRNVELSYFVLIILSLVYRCNRKLINI